MKISIEVDFKSFEYGLIKLEAEVRQKTADGMRRAVERYKRDCLFEIPKVPYDTGELAWGHHTSVEKGPGYVKGILHIDVPYAASLHEGISRWGTPYKFKTPGTGAKWVESKLLRHKEEYIRIATLF